MIKIDKNVPIPKLYRQSKYQWGEMEIGDSIFVEGVTASFIGASARPYGLRNNKKFVVRKVDGGVRVWRIE